MNKNKKSILITGCSSGIGFATAELLNKNGWQVFATCRKMSDVIKLNGLGYNSFLLDYSDKKSFRLIKIGKGKIIKKGKKIAFLNLGTRLNQVLKCITKIQILVV